MLNLKHLYYYHIFAQELSTTEAAKRLRISAPALSNQLKELEGFLGFKLTERIHGKVVITENGKMVAHYADRMFSVYDELNERVSVDSRESNFFRVGVSQNLGPAFSFDLLSLIAETNFMTSPKVDVTFESSDKLLEGFRNKKFDLIFGAFSSELPVESIWVSKSLTFPVRLFAPLTLMNDSEAQGKQPSRSDLNSIIALANKKKISMVLPAKSSVLRDETEQFFLNLKVLPERTIECNNSSAIVQLIERGFAMGFCPTPSLLDFKLGDRLSILGPPGGYWNHGISVLSLNNRERSSTKISPLAEIFSPDIQLN